MKELPIRWTTKDGITIARSRHHNELFIFNFPDGKFFSITAGHDILYRLHPPRHAK